MTNIPCKVHKYLVTFWAILKNITFKVKTIVVIFWQLLVEIGVLYNLTSGHTGLISKDISTTCLLDLLYCIHRILHIKKIDFILISFQVIFYYRRIFTRLANLHDEDLLRIQNQG